MTQQTQPVVPLVSVILPTYNERENIADLARAFLAFSDITLEVIVVDDDSPDGTWREVEGLQAEHSNVRLVRRMNERGLATAIAAGVAQARGDILTWMDCDFSHPPSLLPAMLAELERCPVVIASRYVGGGGMVASRVRIATSRLMNLFARLVLGSTVRDWTSGYVVLRREVLQKAPIEPWGRGYGEYFIALMYRAGKAGYRVREVPYIYSFRTRGSTKTSPSVSRFLGYGWSYFRSILGLRLNLGRPPLQGRRSEQAG